MTSQVNGPPRVVILVDAAFDKCREFYEQVMGLPIIWEWNRLEANHAPTARGVVYSLLPIHIELLHGKPVAPGSSMSLSIQVRDVEVLWPFLSTRAPVVEALATQEWGHRSFAINDPAGTKLQFFSDVSVDRHDS